MLVGPFILARLPPKCYTRHVIITQHWLLHPQEHLRGPKLDNNWTAGINPLKPELNPICYLLALLGAHHFLHVSRIRVKLLTFRLLMS